MEIETRMATADDLDFASDVLTSAFTKDPWMRWTVDSDGYERRVKKLFLITLEEIGLPFGEIWLSQAEDGMHSVAVWRDCDIRLPSTTLETFQGAKVELLGSRYCEAERAETEVADMLPTGRFAYLIALGTSPSVQHRGLGKAVLTKVLERCDTERIGLFLETSSESNIEFYEPFGFSVRSSRKVSSGGPSVWAMFRAENTQL
jgi:ribosomal protein S18 acetylase RimI-like enzyme